MTPKLAEVCLVANLQTLGPLYIADAVGGIFDITSGMLLAGRIVITAGIGSTVSPHRKLHGPVPITELDLEGNYECYFFIDKIRQKPLPQAEYSTGEGSFIICIIIPSDSKVDFRSFEPVIENILQSKSKMIDFSNSVAGELSEELKNDMKSNVIEIYKEINDHLKLAPIYEGRSLFDVGLIASLPEKMSIVAKKLILHPKGIQENQINDKTILKILKQAGLVLLEKRDGETWIIPR